MSASSAGALKQAVEGLGLNLQAFRDAPPANTKLVNPDTGKSTPYCTIAEDLSLTSDGMEDGADNTATELLQLDLWQQWRDANDKPIEDRTLADALHRALVGINAVLGNTLPSSPRQVYGLFVQNRIRLLERGNNIVHHAFSIRLRRII